MAKTNKKQLELEMEGGSGKSRNMKNKVYTLTLLVGVGLIVGALVFKNDGKWDFSFFGGDESDDSEDVEMTELKDDSSDVVVGVAGQNSLEGVLSVSEDSSLGNFKLDSKLGDVYLRTSRDFSNLLGMQVLVLINGTLDKFELVDIKAAVAKDGYLISN